MRPALLVGNIFVVLRGSPLGVGLTNRCFASHALTKSPGAILNSGRLACKGEEQDARNKSESGLQTPS